MRRSKPFRLCVSLAAAMVTLAAARAQDPAPTPTPAPTADVVVLVKGNGSPVNHADVLLSAGEYQDSMHTDPEGHARFSEVPVGAVAVQVTATGWKTYGDAIHTHAGKNGLTVTLEPLPSPTPEPGEDDDARQRPR